MTPLHVDLTFFLRPDDDFDYAEKAIDEIARLYKSMGGDGLPFAKLLRSGERYDWQVDWTLPVFAIRCPIPYDDLAQMLTLLKVAGDYNLLPSVERVYIGSSVWFPESRS